MQDELIDLKTCFFGITYRSRVVVYNQVGSPPPPPLLLGTVILATQSNTAAAHTPPLHFRQ